MRDIKHASEAVTTNATKRISIMDPRVAANHELRKNTTHTWQPEQRSYYDTHRPPEDGNDSGALYFPLAP